MAHRIGMSMTAHHDKQSASDATEPVWARNFRLFFALYALIGGAVSFLGWAGDIPALTDWIHTGVSIQPNSTIAVTFAAAAILFIHLGYRWLAVPLGTVVAAIGVSSLFQLLTGTDLGINTFVMFDREWGRTGAVAPGQIGLPGSISYTLIGFAITLVSVTYKNRGGGVRIAAASLSVITAATAMLSLTGYVYGARPLYTLPNLTVIAMQTATFLLALAISLVFTVRDVGPARLLTENNAAGLMTRRVVPTIILLPILLGFLRLIGERVGLYDLAFGTAAQTLIEIALLLLLLAWGATAVSRQSGRAELQERNLLRLADAMPQVVWIANADGQVSYYNSRASAFGGIKPTPEGLFNWQPTLHSEDLDETIAAWEESVRENRAYEHEHRILMADGTYRWHLSRAIPVMDQDEDQQWFGTATDIHDLKHANTLMRESEERFSRFMHHLPGLAWIKDTAGRYVYINEAAEKVFGHAARDLYGKTDAEIFPADIAASFTQNDQKALESDTGVQVIETLTDETGNARESIVSKFPIPVANAGGPLIGGMAIDITEQRRAQANQQFLFTIGELIRTSRDSGELLAEISAAVGRHLDIHRCFFNEINVQHDSSVAHTDYFRSGASVGGTHKLSDYSSHARELMASGQTVVNRDSATDPRTSDIFSTVYEPNQELAYVAVPMLRDGAWVASFWCSDDQSRDWSATEISLIEAVAERAWGALETARAEEALRDSEERFRLAQQAGNVGIWDWDIVAGRTYWSEQMWTLYDEQPKDIDPDIGFWNARLHADDQKRALDVFERSLSSNVDYHNDVYRVLLKSGGVRWLESIATIERDEAGKPIRMYGVNLDVTEQQVAHDELEVRVVERTQELARTNSLLLRQMEERTLIENQRVRLLKRLFTVQEDERGRIARDIHDHLGQRLTALRLKIASVRALCENDPVLVQRVTRLQEISEILDKDVSFLAWELRPEILDQTDFVHALEQYVHEWSRHSDVFAEFSMIGLRANDLDTDVKNNLYRITQEALNNAAKYSQATQLNVILEQRGGDLLLIIEDNGIGFDIGSRNRDGKRKGFGLVGMRERATLIGGTLEIESAKEHGTTVFVRVPFIESR